MRHRIGILSIVLPALLPLQAADLIEPWERGFSDLELYVTEARCEGRAALSVLGFALEKSKWGAVWQQRLGVKILPISLALTALYVGNTYFAFRQEDVQFANGDVMLAGTLLIPNGDGPHPALAMMHGSGPAPRMGNFA